MFSSDDPEGITLNVPDRDARPNVLDMVWTRHRSSSPKEKAARKVAKKVLTSEMVNGGIKVIPQPHHCPPLHPVVAPGYELCSQGAPGN